MASQIRLRLTLLLLLVLGLDHHCGVFYPQPADAHPNGAGPLVGCLCPEEMHSLAPYSCLCNTTAYKKSQANVLQEFRENCGLADSFNPSYCSVKGVLCNDRGMVNSLNLEGRSLQCSIPYNISKLATLTGLYLTNNKFTGSIPDSIANMTSLWDLDLSGNQLTGSIPSWISQLVNLTHLVLSNNQLTGSIPSGNTLLYYGVSEVELQGNQLSGPLPASFGRILTLKIDWDKFTCPVNGGDCVVKQNNDSPFCGPCKDFCDSCDPFKMSSRSGYMGKLSRAGITGIMVASVVFVPLLLVIA